MVVNPDKFQSIIISKLGKLKESYELLIDDHKIDSENSITLLGIKIDNKLNFEKHITAVCQKASCQLNALPRIHQYIGFQDSFIFSNFNYCRLVWHFCSIALSKKTEKIQERAFRLLYHDSYSSYNSLLLRTERPTMEVSRLRRFAIEVFKTLKPLNPDFMHTHFKKGSHSARKKMT